jgi:adenosylcobinamide-phosphate synthase
MSYAEMLSLHKCSLVLLLACFIDFLIGDPPYFYHPVRLIGYAVSIYEKFLRKRDLSGVFGGLILFILVLATTVSIYLALAVTAYYIHPLIVFIFNVYIVYSCFAFRDLMDHTYPVISALNDGNILYARQRVSRVVGRDVSKMNSSQVARASIETVSENFIDGIVSPLLWYVAGTAVGYYFIGTTCETGTAAMLIFKAVSTMDSMVGYCNKDYEKFGKVSARFDDLINFIPARIALIPLSLASFLINQKTVMGIKIFFRDRLKHLSPNSAHGESFIAGALNIRLGGPSHYQGRLVTKPWLGEGTEDVTPEKITICCRLITYATVISIILALLVLNGFT